MGEIETFTFDVFGILVYRALGFRGIGRSLMHSERISCVGSKLPEKVAEE
jgi:hypothetical protein